MESKGERNVSVAYLPSWDSPMRSTMWFQTTQGATNSGRNLSLASCATSTSTRSPAGTAQDSSHVKLSSTAAGHLGSFYLFPPTLPRHQERHKVRQEPHAGGLCSIYCTRSPAGPAAGHTQNVTRHHMRTGLSQRHVTATLALRTDIVCDTEVVSWQNKAFRWCYGRQGT